MAGLTQPLEFRRFLKTAPKPGFEIVPFVDTILIALFVALNVSAFVIAPGTTISLARSPFVEAPTRSTVAVLTVDRNRLFFFEGAKLSELTLENHLTAFVQQSHGRTGGEDDVTLLIKADASISTDTLFKLMDLARKVGFGRIHLAAEPAEASSLPGPWGEDPPERIP